MITIVHTKKMLLNCYRYNNINNSNIDNSNINNNRILSFLILNEILWYITINNTKF